jgi:hypothetical protein
MYLFASGFRSSGMWHCVIGWVAAIYWKDRSVFVFTAWTLKLKALRTFEMSEISHITTQCHNSEDPNLKSSIFIRIQATAYRWLRTVLSVTICVQMLLIADSALFYPWPSVFRCCLSLTLHYFIHDHLCSNAAYRSPRTFLFLSVTICVQLLLIADSALFYPWLSVYNCCLSLAPHYFFRDHLCTTVVEFREH